ncbi:MAG: YceH family protein [Planctomycetota bacterium]
MPLHLDSLEQRVIGTLIEKELTVPDAYPLTLNALVTGCNQKNNRDPVLEVEDFDVEGALRSLMDKSWVTRRERDGGRTMRYAHEAKAQLGVDLADLAILAELMLRGPQAAGALRTRASRMAHVGEAADVEARLEALAARPVPYVTRLPRRPREQQPRWAHLLDGRSPEEAVADWGEGDAPSAPSSASVPAVGPSRGSADPSPVEALEQRLAELETQLDDLLRRIERLEGR